MNLLSANDLHDVTTDLRSALARLDALRAAGNYTGVLDYADLAGRLRRVSLKRSQFFPGLPLFDPAWHILLDLYAAAGTGSRLSVSAICGDCGAPPTTALRYIEAVVETGLARRDRDEKDGRRIWVVITDAGRASLERYLDTFVATLR